MTFDRQMDGKDVSSMPTDLDGKQHHVVERLDVIDTGTSVIHSSAAQQLLL